MTTTTIGGFVPAERFGKGACTFLKPLSRFRWIALFVLIAEFTENAYITHKKQNYAWMSAFWLLLNSKLFVPHSLLLARLASCSRSMMFSLFLITVHP